MKRLFFAFVFFGLLASCNSSLPIGAVKVHRGAVENIVASTTSGTVKAKSHSLLSFGKPGRMAITFVKEGDPVTKGMVLAELENTDLKAINEQNRKEMKRFESLSKAKLASNFNLDTAKKNFEVSNTELERTMIRAPYDGLITDVNLNIGQFYNIVADEAHPPMRIIDRENRLVEGQIDEVDITKVKIGNVAHIKIPALNNRTFEARVVNVIPFVSSIKEQDRTSKITIEINDPESTLIPVGVSADIEIVVEEKQNIAVLPAHVVMGVGKDRSVFIVKNGKLLKKDIKVGLTNYKVVEVLQGLVVGDLVAIPPEDVDMVDGLKVQEEIVTWQ